MRCDAAQLALSVSMDERSTSSPDVEAHLRTCPVCGRFEQAAWRIRELARFEVAPPVPDMVPAIMDKVDEVEADRLLGWGPQPGRTRARLRWIVAQRGIVAAAAAGVILGLLLTTGGVVPIGGRINTVALAGQIPSRLARAASTLDGYRATFDITESHWARAVPRRTFVADVAFLAPESFSVVVRDTTRYPSEAWPRNDLRLVTDGRSWEASGPDPCPSAALPACPTVAPVKRSIVERPPFDARSGMPTDVIVPTTVLAAADRVTVVGPDTVAGRAAVAIELPYEEAVPLFQYLQFLGSWRPFFPQDRVELWLDRDTWFPLRYEVFPTPGPERSLWSSQMGLPTEPGDAPVFDATVRSLSTKEPPAALFAPRPGPEAVDEGFQDLPLPPTKGCPKNEGIVRPCFVAGLRRYRFGQFARSPLRPYSESVLAYASGLSWMTVTRVQQWNQPSLFGLEAFPEPVKLSPRGVGYYQPATESAPRRVALHTTRGEFLVSSNLSRSQLLRVAGSLPVTGLKQPDSWRVRRWPGGVVELGVARARFDLLSATYLPPGYRRVADQTARSTNVTGVTIVYRQPSAELDGIGIVLYQAAGQTLAPPDSADQQSVDVGGNQGRWSPEKHLLEWMDGNIYRSVSGSAFDLSTLLRVAESLRRPAP